MSLLVRSRALVAASALLVALALLATPVGAMTHAGRGRAADSMLIKLGTEPWIGYGPWWIAQKKDFFAKEGVDVQIVNFEQDADRNAALASGQTQFSNIDTGRTIQMVANNKLKISLLLLLDDSEGADAMLATKSIHSLQGLRGQHIAYEQGTTSDLLLHYALRKAGIPFSAVHPVYIPAANAATALVAGHVTAAVTYEPYISNVVAAHGANIHVLYSSAQVPGLIGDYLVSNRAFVQAHPDVARRLLRAWNDAMNYWATHRADGTAIMAAGVGSTVAALQSTLRGVKIYTVAQNRSLLSSGEMARRYRLVGDTLMSEKVVKRTVAASTVLDLSYLPH